MDFDEGCLLGRHYRTGKCVLVCCRNGRITELREIAYIGDSARQLPLIGPGFVDLQVNGMGGEDFNGGSVDTGITQRIAPILWKTGVTSYCPTLITSAPEQLERSLSVMASSLTSDSLEASTVAALHLEGPFISPEDGARGAHPLEYVQAPNWERFQKWNEAAFGWIKLVTLSPEWPQSTAFIEQCAAAGITVSIGHTAATPEQLEAAAAAGASLITHFGNGAHPLLPRHPNYLWSQLADDRLACCVIADGFHVPDAVLKVVCKVKGSGMVLVSDAVQLCGMPPGAYHMPVGGEVVLREDGRLHLQSDPRLLAGSARPLLWGVNHLIRRGICMLAEAWEMASIHAARQLGMPQAEGLVPGAPADLVMLQEKDGQYEVVQTIKSGVMVYESAGRWA